LEKWLKELKATNSLLYHVLIALRPTSSSMMSSLATTLSSIQTLHSSSKCLLQGEKLFNLAINQF